MKKKVKIKRKKKNHFKVQVKFIASANTFKIYFCSTYFWQMTPNNYAISLIFHMDWNKLFFFIFSLTLFFFIFAYVQFSFLFRYCLTRSSIIFRDDIIETYSITTTKPPTTCLLICFCQEQSEWKKKKKIWSMLTWK